MRRNMDEIEEFMIKLSQIVDKDTNTEQIAIFVFDSFGWNVLASIYENRLRIDELILDKLVDLLISTCSKLIVNLPSLNSIHNEPIVELDKRDVYLNLFDKKHKENKSIRLNIDKNQGTICDLIVISLELFMRFNDGSQSNILLFNPSSMSHIKSNNIKILSDFSTNLFNLSENVSNNRLFKLIYLRFLGNLFSLNFETVHSKGIGTISAKTNINESFLLLFKSISNKIQKDQQLASWFYDFVIHYLGEFVNLNETNSKHSHYNSPTNKSVITNHLNIVIFQQLLVLLSEVYQFLIDCVANQITESNKTINSKTEFQEKPIESGYHKFVALLTQLKSNKNYFEHCQNCLRNKHNHLTCKINLNELSVKHNDITSINSTCLLADIFKYSLNKLINANNKAESELIVILNTLGVCCCIKPNELLELHKSMSSTTSESNYYFNNELGSIVIEYFVQITDTETIKTDESKNKSQKSIFFPLMADESLVENHASKMAPNLNILFEILLEMNEKSVLLCKYLSHSLNFFYSKKFAKSTSIPFASPTHGQETSNSMSTQFLKYKFFSLETLSFFKKFICHLKNEKCLDDGQHLTNTKALIEIICDYIYKFFFIYNQESAKADNENNLKLKDKEMRSKLDEHFVQLINAFSSHVFDDLTFLCDKLALTFERSFAIGSQLIIYKNQNENSKNHLVRVLIKRIISENQAYLFNSSFLLTSILETYLKCSEFRCVFDECNEFQTNLICYLNKQFETTFSSSNSSFNEALFYLAFVYFSSHRKEYMNDMYVSIRKYLNDNPSFLGSIYNIITLRSAFKSKLNHDSSQTKVYLRKDSSFISATLDDKNESHAYDYDADSEFNAQDISNHKEAEHGFDLILFPRLLEICLSKIVQSRQSTFEQLKSSHEIEHDVNEHWQQILNFTRKLSYLTASNQMNSQIIINYNLQKYLMEIIDHPLDSNAFIQTSQEMYKKLIEIETVLFKECFDILFSLCSYDMSDTLMSKLIQYSLESVPSSDQQNCLGNFSLQRKTSSVKLIKRLTENLPSFHSTFYVEFPHQLQEPIDQILNLNSKQKKWKINLNYEPFSHSSLDAKSPKAKDSHKQNDANASSILNELKLNRGEELACIRITLDSTIQLPNKLTDTNKLIKNSYSIIFMLRLDTNLTNYLKASGLSSQTNSHGESFIHLMTLNLNSESCCAELWLNSNGNLLFIRRSNQSIIIAFNLLSISQSNNWNLLFINYEEETNDEIQYNCKISHSLNMSHIVEKEFELFFPSQPIKHALSKINENSSCFFYLGHQEKDANVSGSFKYDLGQVILSKNTKYSREHLLILMQIMDTNVNLLENCADHQWIYLNDFQSIDLNTIEKIQKNFPEYCEQIKSSVVCVYHPKSTNIYGLKNSKGFSYNSLDLMKYNCRSLHQSKIDTVIARLGGVSHFLFLIAKLVEQEHELFQTFRKSSKNPESNYLEWQIELISDFPSLNALESLLSLINQRPNFHNDFNTLDGYNLLARIFTSIASLSRYSTEKSKEPNFYGTIQKRLFVTLINSCFRTPLFRLNNYMPEGIEVFIKSYKNHISSGRLSLINIELLGRVIVEWELWRPFHGLKLKPDKKEIVHERTCLWTYLFQTLNELLDHDLTRFNYSNLFLKFKLLEKLMHFLLDANEENCTFDKKSSESFIQIFLSFSSIVLSNSALAKRLFIDLFEYTHILHPETKDYIVYSTKSFYFNLTLNTKSIPFSSLQDQQSTKTNNVTFDLDPSSFDQSQPSADTLNEKDTSANELDSSRKRPMVTLDRFQHNSVNSNFSQISAGLMEIMLEILPNLNDLTVNDLLNTLGFESFIMFALDENQEKRLIAFKLFLSLIERSSTTAFFFTSSLVNAANVVGYAAANPIMAQQSLNRNLEQQTSQSNKEYLIYAMCNQLNQFDQIDERFVEFCIGKLLNTADFNLKHLFDLQIIKSASSSIQSRLNYVLLLISMLYSSRKNVKLCRECLNFLFVVSELEIVRVEFLVNKAGLIQVLINLLQFYSDINHSTKLQEQQKMQQQQVNQKQFLYQQSSGEKDAKNDNECLKILHEIKGFFCLLTRLMLKVQENQESDYFGYWISTLTALTYESSNIGYEDLHFNLKSIVLNIIKSTSSDIKSMLPIRESNTNSLFLFKKIIMPLISMSKGEILDQQHQASANSLFENELKFQKFIIFIADFIFVIYDKISDKPIANENEDINDHLASITFDLLRHLVKLGLDYTEKTKLSVLVRNNMTLIRSQLKKMLLLMLHPNHKQTTRINIIKNLLSTSHCEALIKFLIISDGQQSFNLKFTFYLNALFNLKPIMKKSDVEVLTMFNRLLIEAGFNTKFEFTPNTSFLLANSSEGFEIVDSSPLISSNRKSTLDLNTQFDKEIDTEVLGIYRKTSAHFKRFLQQFDRLTEDLMHFSTHLTNLVVSMHSKFRKSDLQRLKYKRIQQYDAKQKWIRLIDNMTHERCIGFEARCAPMFSVLDYTEGPNRERRRLRKAHLFIPERFFKTEIKQHLANEKQSKPLKYLLNNYDDYLSSDSFQASSIGDFILYQLKNNENIESTHTCKNVMPFCEIKGELLLTDARIYFSADENSFTHFMGIENVTSSWSYNDIKEIHERRYLLKDIGIELFLSFGQTILLAFDDTKERNTILKMIKSKRLISLVKTDRTIEEATNMWKEGKMSNYEYLMQLNKYSGRTFNDLMQYPIYPHVLANYSSQTLDLSRKENYRNFAKPIAIQRKEKEEKFLQNYRMLEESTGKPYHYASLYSNSGTVLHYLVRLPPFTKMFLDYQDQNFDVPDRTFHSIETTWLLSSSESTTDYKELIPEFFFLHEFLTNQQGFEFGVRQNGERIDNVAMPLWSNNNPRLFIYVMRQALESNYVTSNLNYWIDLIFGYKQEGRAAIEAINCFHPACYFGYPVEQITDKVERKATETMIKTWGQTPKKLFQSNHPQSTAKIANSGAITTSFANDSIHNLILNIKWGTYVGSLEQQSMPVCVWKENFKKNIHSLYSFQSAANHVIGLSRNKCLLIDRNDEYVFVRNSDDTQHVNILEWDSYDDHIKLRTDSDKSTYNIVPIRSNEHTVVCCNCIAFNLLVFGTKSGLLSVHKLKKEKLQISYDGFVTHLFGHRTEITEIQVNLNFSTMITASQDGLLIIWDTNRLQYVNSIFIQEQYIYRVSLSETTNDIAFIGNSPNKLYLYTGNCEYVGQKEPAEQEDQSVLMKCLCFSNATEGLNVNVIAVGLSNGRIRLFSSWDLTLLRELSVHFDTFTQVGSIVALTYTKDCKRLYVSDTFSRVYILEACNSQAAMAKNVQAKMNHSTSLQQQFIQNPAQIMNSIYVYSSNLTCFT